MNDSETAIQAHEWSAALETVDHDEYGRPVREEYRRLGASGREEGIYVRFEPGFGLNVHIGMRIQRFEAGYGRRPEWRDLDEREFRMSIDGWERLCDLADEWRARRSETATAERPTEPEDNGSSSEAAS